MRSLLPILLLCAAAACTRGTVSDVTPETPAKEAYDATLTATPQPFSAYGTQAVQTMVQSILTSTGDWKLCESGCAAVNHDWGADSFTYALALRWRITHDSSLVPYLDKLAHTASSYAGCSTASCGFSDEPEWDSIAESREYEATHDAVALQKAEAAYAYVQNVNFFALGACPQIHYQIPSGTTGLKTLETDANAIKAALLLYQITNRSSYLSQARSLYAAVRAHFLDPASSLYTVYLFDNKVTCTQVPHRFFASVNGDMIDNGVLLAQLTKDATYLSDARATATAVELRLADPNHVFANLQAENDVAEPLVEAMYDLATIDADTPARNWIITNAKAALEQTRDAKGWYGRFFDGYTPSWNVTAWQTSGGLALAIAAAAVAPSTIPTAGDWAGALHVAVDYTSLPTPVIAVQGRAVAFVGTIGDRCCQAGHAGVVVDNSQTFDETGVWQNKSSANLPIPGAILFAWRWPQSGSHRVQFIPPGNNNVKEGGPYIHVTGYYVVP